MKGPGSLHHVGWTPADSSEATPTGRYHRRHNGSLRDWRGARLDSGGYDRGFGDRGTDYPYTSYA